MPETLEAAIACTLQPGDFKTRLASIAALNKSALLDDRRDDLRLDLTYSIDARDQVLAMVEGEQACCAFLDFTVIETNETIRVTVIAPEAAREAAETVFEPFRSRQTLEDPQDESCASCPTSVEADATALIPSGDKTTGKVVGATAALAAASALACGVCCVLPFALPAAVVAVGGGAMAWFAGKQGIITSVAAVAVITAWGWVAFQSYRSRKRPATSTFLVMGFATIMLIAAFQWPLLEPLAFHLIGK